MSSKPYQLARIREAECVGCTKCIDACPVDAIIGSAQQTHTVISQECIGCKLCIAPCPVDCIDIITINQRLYDPEKTQQRAKMRKQRLLKDQEIAACTYAQAEENTIIQAALARVKLKK